MTKGFDQLGFTLIEIIVVFTIIAILSIIGVAAFVSYGRIQTLETSTSNLKSTLFLAKSRAISQVNTECNKRSQILDGYQVVIFTSDNHYELQSVCSTNFTYTISSTTLPKNITFDSRTPSTPFFFRVISGGVKDTGTIYLVGYGNERRILIDSTGGIQQTQ